MIGGPPSDVGARADLRLAVDEVAASLGDGLDEHVQVGDEPVDDRRVISEYRHVKLNINTVNNILIILIFWILVNYILQEEL